MEKDILELLYELKKKCIVNDDAFMAKTDLSQAEYQLFIAISTCKDINSNALSMKTGLSLSRISRVIDKMVNNGYMTRETHSSDRRAIKLELTKEGRKLMVRIINYRKECELRILKNVSNKELDTIKHSFDTVLKLL